MPSSEECLPFSVCFPSRKQPGASAFQPRKQKIWGWGGGKSSHSCTSQISESSGGSFLSCRRSANTCSEWTLLSVRRLTSFISIRGNISRSWGKEGTKYSFCLSPGKGARVGELWKRQQIVCARCRQGRILEGKVGVSGDEPLGKRKRGEGRLTWGWWMET